MPMLMQLEMLASGADAIYMLASGANAMGKLALAVAENNANDS
jgi:hypothetical protein